MQAAILYSFTREYELGREPRLLSLDAYVHITFNYEYMPADDAVPNLCPSRNKEFSDKGG